VVWNAERAGEPPSGNASYQMAAGNLHLRQLPEGSPSSIDVGAPSAAILRSTSRARRQRDGESWRGADNRSGRATGFASGLYPPQSRASCRKFAMISREFSGVPAISI